PQRTFQPVSYTPEEYQRIQLLLDKVLGPEYVSSRPGGGGQKVSYIEGWKALNLANEIFGFNGWNSELISTQVDYFDTHGNSGRFSMGLSVVVRVTIKDGAYHEDFGYGYIDNAKSKAMAFEKCKKEAFTDGVKRCLRCFGNVLGNCLYDRNIISKIQKVKLPQPDLEDSDFYRDPMLVERERRKLTSTKVNLLERRDPAAPVAPPAPKATTNPVPTTPNPSHASGAPQRHTSIPPGPPKTKTYTPSAQELEELDESFFSDDLMEEAEPEDKGSKDTDIEPRQLVPDKPQQFPLFVSAKGADLLQQTPEDITKLPQFDPKFVSPNIKRTLPNTSAPVKRTEVSAVSSQSISRVYPPSQSENNALGKRIGMPPSQRPAKR
ncbi:recombination protein Rad52, partial [Suhomyces tanzawaensis NRRL Y-17324]